MEPIMDPAELGILQTMVWRICRLILEAHEVEVEESWPLQSLAEECKKLAKECSYRLLALSLVENLSNPKLRIIEVRSALGIFEDWVQSLSFDPQVPLSPAVILDWIKCYRAGLFWSYESKINEVSIKQLEKQPPTTKKPLVLNPEAKCFVPKS